MKKFWVIAFAIFSLLLVAKPVLAQTAQNVGPGGGPETTTPRSGTNQPQNSQTENRGSINNIHQDTAAGRVQQVNEATRDGHAGSPSSTYWFTQGLADLAGGSILGMVLGPVSSDTTLGQATESPLALVNDIFGGMYAPAASTPVYVADLMNHAGLNIAQPAYAQGLGFASLDPILETWKIFRNIAYLFYVLLFLVIGFMIMFRQKISSQAVVTAQQALPNIVVSLIAVTFSYAIAGLLIDIMYIAMYLAIGLFSTYTYTYGSPPIEYNFNQLLMNKNIFSIGVTLIEANTLGNAVLSIQELVSSSFGQLEGGVTEFIGGLAGIGFATVFAIALLFGIFRLFFELVKIYISIIISIVMSPLALMLGALPGNNAFRSWLRVLVANLAVFPTILLILIISFVLLGASPNGETGGGYTASNGEESAGFIPPFLPGRGSSNSITVVLALGMILIMPDLALQVKKSIGGSGGIFEQFANNFTSALDKGVKGGPLVPGVGFTDVGIAARNIPRALIGTDKSRKDAEAGKGVLGNGLVGGLWNQRSKFIRRANEDANANKPDTSPQVAPKVPSLRDTFPTQPTRDALGLHGSAAAHGGHGHTASTPKPEEANNSVKGTPLKP